MSFTACTLAYINSMSQAFTTYTVMIYIHRFVSFCVVRLPSEVNLFSVIPRMPQTRSVLQWKMPWVLSADILRNEHDLRNEGERQRQQHRLGQRRGERHTLGSRVWTLSSSVLSVFWAKCQRLHLMYPALLSAEQHLHLSDRRRHPRLLHPPQKKRNPQHRRRMCCYLFDDLPHNICHNAVPVTWQMSMLSEKIPGWLQD